MVEWEAYPHPALGPLQPPDHVHAQASVPVCATESQRRALMGELQLHESVLL